MIGRTKEGNKRGRRGVEKQRERERERERG